MNLNKELPKGTGSLLTSIVSFAISAVLFVPGLTSIKTDDSGVGILFGEVLVVLAAVPFIIGTVSLLNFLKNKRSNLK